jgi:hypothetical protein
LAFQFIKITRFDALPLFIRELVMLISIRFCVLAGGICESHNGILFVKLQHAVKYTAIDDGIWTVQDNKKPAKL